MYLLGHRQIDNNGLSKQKVRLVMRCCCWVDLIYPFKRASAAMCDTHVCAGDLERKTFFFFKVSVQLSVRLSPLYESLQFSLPHPYLYTLTGPSPSKRKCKSLPCRESS